MSSKNPVVHAEVDELRPYQRVVNYLVERAEVDAGDYDPEELTAEQVDRIMVAANEDELFEAMKTAGLTGLKDLDNGTRITIHGFRLVAGTLGIGVYAILEATDPDTGENLALDTGVTRILAFLRMCEVMQKFPVTVVVDKKTTASGNELITFKRAGKAPVKATAE
jgi:hypothetical protein